MRSSLRRQMRNQTVTSRVKTLEKKYLTLLKADNKDEAKTALRDTVSALDQAAKRGVVHRTAANRKKSRLTHHLNAALGQAPTLAAAPAAPESA